MINAEDFLRKHPAPKQEDLSEEKIQQIAKSEKSTRGAFGEDFSDFVSFSTQESGCAKEQEFLDSTCEDSVVENLTEHMLQSSEFEIETDEPAHDSQFESTVSNHVVYTHSFGASTNDGDELNSFKSRKKSQRLQQKRYEVRSRRIKKRL
ncbi:MAG: hypothetical protein Q3961_01910, partial [Bifidobacteriaceae bacterium]|nr:hypothetical protein [Bifidobacteriaceae bacterium]